MTSHTFEPIAGTYAKIRNHIREFELPDKQRAYPAVLKRINDVRQLYLTWMDLCEEYRLGFEKTEVKRPIRYMRLHLSNLGTGVEDNFFEVAKARIPPEVYFMVQDFYQTFDTHSDFVIAAGDGFELETVHGEVEKELKEFPFPSRQAAAADKFKELIRKGDYTKIYYESIMYDSPLTWPLLLHEVFHDIYAKEEIGKQLNLPFHEDWVAEVIIDLYAAIFFGPAYAMSLAQYHERYPGGGGVSHPTEGARLAGLLSLMDDMYEQKSKYAPSVQRIVEKSRRFVNDIWSTYRREKPAIQSRAVEIYNKVRDPAIAFHHKKKQRTFEELVTSNRSEIGKDFQRVDDYMRLGIPVALAPRILFNGLIVVATDPEYEFVSESIKKWHLSNLWPKEAGQNK